MNSMRIYAFASGDNPGLLAMDVSNEKEGMTSLEFGYMTIEQAHDLKEILEREIVVAKNNLVCPTCGQKRG